MLGLGSSLHKAGKIGKSIIRDGLVLKHDYNAGAVEPVSSGAASFTASSNEYITAGDDTTLDPAAGSFSISCWVNSNLASTLSYTWVLRWFLSNPLMDGEDCKYLKAFLIRCHGSSYRTG